MRSTITPHPSHTWGTWEGEPVCKKCNCQPDMPISERRCGDEARDPLENVARDAAILRAYESGESVKHIAISMDLTRGTVSKTIERRLAALSPKALERRTRSPSTTLAELRQAMALQEQGKSLRQIGDILGRKPASLKDALQDFRAGRGRLAAQAAAERQAAGEPLAVIAADMGIGYETLCQALRRNLTKQA